MRVLFRWQSSFMLRDPSPTPSRSAWPGRLAVLICLLASFGLPAYGQVRTIQLAPPSSQLEIRTYGVGFLPVDSTLTSFQGTLTYNPSDHASCEATFTAAVASLVTSNSAVRDIVVGPEFLDAMHFPSLRYAGSCDGSELSGTLTMRGATHPFRLKLTWDPHRVIAQGTLSRREWGMTAKPFLVGNTVRIRVTTNLP